MWLPWLQGARSLFTHSSGGALAYWEGHHNGYCRLKPAVDHQRGIVRLGDESWLVVDRLYSLGSHKYRLHWLLGNFPYNWNPDIGSLVLDTKKGAYKISMGVLSGGSTSSLVRADPYTPRGWQAPFYYSREPAVSVELVQEASESCFWTLFSPLDPVVEQEAYNLTIRSRPWTAVVSFGEDNTTPLVKQITIDGSHDDHLDLLS